MAITQLYSTSGTVGTAEFSFVSGNTTLQSDGTDGVYQFVLDVSALAAGDAFQITVYEKALSSSSKRVAWQATLSGAQGLPVYLTPAFTLLHGWDVTAKKLSGTDRAIECSTRRIS